MKELYYNLVINKLRTCDENNKEVPLVPKNLRESVIKMLEQQGYDKNGDVI